MNDKITIDNLRNNIAKMQPDDKAIILEALSRINIDLSKSKGELTGTGVYGFIFDNAMHEAYSHKDAYIKITQLVARKYPDKVELLLGIQGKTKKYFSKSVSDFPHGYEKIKGTDIYADTNENAKQLNRRCQRILQTFGIDPSTLLIIPR